MYDSWGQKTYEVPVGDFCSNAITLKKPYCAKGTKVFSNKDKTPTISIRDGEGTDCTISMYNSPGI